MKTILQPIMTNLQELKKEIQKAVPEIMELKEGCLLWNTYQTPDIGCGYNFVRQQGESMLVRTPQHWKKGGGQRASVDTKKSNGDYVFITLGRPITLEDVLVALELDFESKSNLKRKYSETTILWLVKHWQLNTPLEEQEEKTIDFLHDLLVNN